jgi:hypothetical protein
LKKTSAVAGTDATAPIMAISIEYLVLQLVDM